MINKELCKWDKALFYWILRINLVIKNVVLTQLPQPILQNDI
jgi:hypothetical protein